MNKKLVKIKSTDQTAVVSLKAGSITDAEQIKKIQHRINSLVEETKPKKLIIDFQSVRFFSSQMLGMLVELRTKLQSCNTEVLISSINPQLHRVFRITNLDKIFRFFQNVEKALEDKS